MKYYEGNRLTINLKVNDLLLEIYSLKTLIKNSQKKHINKEVTFKQYFSEVFTSNTIEGIFVENAKKVFISNNQNIDKTEKEWIGLKLAFNWVLANYERQEVNGFTIKQLHKIILNGSKNDIAGKYKTKENWIVSIENGKVKEHIETSKPENTDQDINSALEKLNNFMHEPSKGLISILIFINEFLNIHPFSDGNGRMSRLLLIWLLLQAGYEQAKYISLTKYIGETKEQYYSVLRSSTRGVVEQNFSFIYIGNFLEYYLEIIKKTQMEYLSLIKENGVKYKDQLEQCINSFRGEFKAADILKIIPGISRSYISKYLKEKIQSGLFKKMGIGKGTKYLKNQ